MLEEKKSTIGKKMSNFVIIRLLEKNWQDYVHPDDLPLYKGVIDAVICGSDDMKYLESLYPWRNE